MYRIIAYDGSRPPIVADVTREELRGMIRATIIGSIRASFAIEGEPIPEGAEDFLPDEVPENLLTTPGGVSFSKPPSP